MEAVGLELLGERAAPLVELLPAGGETGGAAAHQLLGVEVVRKVFVDVLRPDGVEVPLENLPGRGDVGSLCIYGGHADEEYDSGNAHAHILRCDSPSAA